jgi:hypothetical protein
VTSSHLLARVGPGTPTIHGRCKAGPCRRHSQGPEAPRFNAKMRASEIQVALPCHSRPWLQKERDSGAHLRPATGHKRTLAASSPHHPRPVYQVTTVSPSINAQEKTTKWLWEPSSSLGKDPEPLILPTMRDCLAAKHGYPAKKSPKAARGIADSSAVAPATLARSRPSRCSRTDTML